MKFIKNPLEFFLMGDFNFSLFGAIFGFLCVMTVLLRLEKTEFSRYIDGIVLSFLLVAVVGYIGAFLGGQVYGRETMLGIEIAYTNAHSPVPFQVPVFPLPFVYAISSFILLSILYILSLFIHLRGYIGYIGVVAFSAIVLIFEFFSGKQDIISIHSIFNLSQICALFLAIWGGYQLYRLFDRDNSSSQHLES